MLRKSFRLGQCYSNTLFAQMQFLLLHSRRAKRKRRSKKYLCFNFIGLKHWLQQRKINSLSLFCATAQREFTRNVNHFCTAFAEIRVLLQGSLDQIKLCGIFKAKFKTPRTHTIAAPGTVEELQHSLLTLIYPPALNQHSDCFQHVCMPRRASAYCVMKGFCLQWS